MLLERIVTEGLAHYSYLVGDRNEALVIDPRRDVDVYLDMADRGEMRICCILETHRNEDYFIGSQELAARTGAEVWHADAQWDYRYGRPAIDGQRWKAGRMVVEAIATPGHTPGSMSYMLRDPAGFPWMLFSGDALFAGDVGRIDLLGPEKAPSLAALLYDSIFSRILPLGDDVILCPAHGSGSVCAESIAERLWTTIGLERKNNLRLQANGREEFIAGLLASHPDRPPHFQRMEAVNLEGGPLIGAASLKALSAKEFSAQAEGERAQVIDVRQETAYSAAHIAGSQFIWLDGLAGFAGWFIGYDRPVVLVGGCRSDVEKARAILLRLGFDGISGYLAGGMLSWHTAGMMSQFVKTLTVQELCRRLDAQTGDEAEGSDPDLWILDVRSSGELERDGRIKGAVHIHITEIAARADEIPKDRTVCIFCGSGLRSMVAASFLKARGWTDIEVVLGGMAGWRSRRCPVKKNREERVD